MDLPENVIPLPKNLYAYIAQPIPRVPMHNTSHSKYDADVRAALFIILNGPGVSLGSNPQIFVFPETLKVKTPIELRAGLKGVEAIVAPTAVPLPSTRQLAPFSSRHRIRTSDGAAAPAPLRAP
jgi:hypothetical protein